MVNKNYIAMIVAGLAVDPMTNAPIVLLKDPESDICLPIWIGYPEASSIAVALKEIEVSRPLTHDLMKAALDATNAYVVRVSIIGIEEDTFIAEIELNVGEVCKVLDSRPSDAIALALRYLIPIYVSKVVLESAKGLVISASADPNIPVDAEGDNQSVMDLEILSNNESANFFKIGNTGLEGFDAKSLLDCFETLNPADFKYKM